MMLLKNRVADSGVACLRTVSAGFSQVVHRHVIAARRANKKVNVGGVGVVISGIGPAMAARLAVGNKANVAGNVSVNSPSRQSAWINPKFTSIERASRPSQRQLTWQRPQRFSARASAQRDFWASARGGRAIGLGAIACLCRRGVRRGSVFVAWSAVELYGVCWIAKRAGGSGGDDGGCSSDGGQRGHREMYLPLASRVAAGLKSSHHRTGGRSGRAAPRGLSPVSFFRMVGGEDCHARIGGGRDRAVAGV
jgi:hypothetical protein